MAMATANRASAICTGTALAPGTCLSTTDDRLAYLSVPATTPAANNNAQDRIVVLAM
jgi:hypothetical protein